MVDLKTYLLNTGYFIDNQYLNEYIKLVSSPIQKSGYHEKHHILQVSYYKHLHNCKNYIEAVKFADADQNNSCITLLYKDHCKAHWLLYYCTIDFLKADNAAAVEYIKKMYIKLTNKNRFEFNEIDFNIIQNYMNDIINNKASKWYADSELEFLINNYSKLGANECANILDRSVGSIHSKALELNLCQKRPELWTVDEDNILKKYFILEGRLVYKRLPGRSKLACQKRAFKLGLHSESQLWTDEQKNFLKENYAKLGPQGISKYIDKTAVQCRSMAQRLGLYNTTKQKKWTEQEIQFLLKNYYELGAEKTAALLNRTAAQCTKKIYKLKNEGK